MSAIAGLADEEPSALEKDPAGWVDLLPAADLKGWSRLPVPAKGQIHRDVPVWKVDADAGLLICDGQLPASKGSHEFLRYDRELADSLFHVEWRYTDPKREGWNSGIYVRNSADGTIWHQAQVGNKAGGFLFGDTLPEKDGKYTRFNLSKQSANRVKPVEEWNTFEITCKGKEITVWVNGGAACQWDECPVAKGYLGLEAEFHRIEFRNLKLKELK